MSDEEFLDLCENEKNLEEIEDALKNGANVNARYDDGSTALFYAFDTDYAELLLKYGIDVNARDNNGCTALFFAINASMADTLLEYGADLNARNNYGMTALDRAIYLEHNDRIECLAFKTDTNILNETLRGVQIPEIAHGLVMFGADVNSKGDSPLTSAYDRGKLDVVKVLISHGVEI